MCARVFAGFLYFPKEPVSCLVFCQTSVKMVWPSLSICTTEWGGFSFRRDRRDTWRTKLPPWNDNRGQRRRAYLSIEHTKVPTHQQPGSKRGVGMCFSVWLWNPKAPTGCSSNVEAGSRSSRQKEDSRVCTPRVLLLLGYSRYEMGIKM